MSAGAVYYLVFQTTASSAGNYYEWRATTSDNQTSSDGWTIEDNSSLEAVSDIWQGGLNDRSGMFSISATKNSLLTASNATYTGATLTLTGHTGNWHYKHTAPAGGDCSTSAVSGTTANVAGLTAGTKYTFKAYSDSGCATEIADANAEFTTLGVSVGNFVNNLGFNQLSVGVHQINTFTEKWATQFTTGAHSNGYTLQSVTAAFMEDAGTPGAIRVTVHADDGGKPSIAAAAQLSGGGNPETGGVYVYACDSGCNLSANTNYHVAFDQASASLSPGNYYKWRAIEDNSDTDVPDDAGWSIGNGSSQWRSSTQVWDANGNADLSGVFRVSAIENASLTASNVTGTGATLTLSDYTGDWRYKYTSPSGGTCSPSAVSETTATLSNLTPGTDYTFKAYSDSGCSTEIAGASAAFTTPASLAASNVSATGATLTLTGYSGNWRYQHTTPSGGDCSASAVSGTTKNLTGLTAGTTYIFKAYSDSACSTRIATADAFTTDGVSVNNLEKTD